MVWWARGSDGRGWLIQAFSPVVRLRALLLGMGLLTVALVAGFCSRNPFEVTVPVSNWPGYEYFYLAAQKDLAAARGLTLRTAEFPDPQAIVHAYLRGEL
ncbi:MAG: hypothetical protein FJ054_05730 [Cyanobacteria bacterium M_surface_10_m2_119]|nr:hypothetical protein [Cyanobacteria bacterium M_surface_10_m2_119]